MYLCENLKMVGTKFTDFLHTLKADILGVLYMMVEPPMYTGRIGAVIGTTNLKSHCMPFTQVVRGVQ